jgi:NADH:ubiquinone oxidoreductase subunit C
MCTQERLLLFSSRILDGSRKGSIKTLSELYPNSVWLEREVSELHAVTFEGKKDVRNLMLQYGDSSAPFRKSFPSIGTREMYYDGVNDVISQNTVSTQI